MNTIFLQHLSGLLSYTVPLAVILSAYFSYSQITKKEITHNFIFKEKRSYPEYNIEAFLYIHSIHGSPFIHIQTNDTHNFFATTFRTTCIDDTGSTHVLEHMSLHGSDHYPINSVFSELLKRSLATLLNAFTSIEWTAYPFSTTNSNDFFNILDVYLDASFHPQLNQIAFESECHHLEFESPNDTSSALHHSGVVYNEMVGSLSKPSDYFESLIRKNLYPDSLFRLEYGGYPPAIANLTLEQLKRMHDMYYHPSNALFFHYGSFDLDKIMQKVDQVISDPQFNNADKVLFHGNNNNQNIKKDQENDLEDNIYQQIDDNDNQNNEINDGNYQPNDDKVELKQNQLDDHKRLQQNSKKDETKIIQNKDLKSNNPELRIKEKKVKEYFDLEKLINQPRWNSPRYVIAEGPSNGQIGDNGEEKVTVSVSWMVGDLRNVTEITDLTFLSLLLTDTILSPLYKSLITTRIGTNFINTGFMSYTRSPYFCIGLEGVEMTEAIKFNQTVLDILNDVYKNGFDSDRIYSTLHNFEISQKTISNQQGINFWHGLISFWIHNVNPFEVLDENWQIERIKRILKINPRYFEMILKHQLINNKHRLDLIMKGVQNFQEKQAEKVKQELAEMKEKMSNSELKKIVEETNKIQQFVDAPRPVHLLPSITKNDINETQPTKLKVEYPLNNDKIMTFVQPTNDIVYLTVKCDLPVDSKDIELVPILSLLLNQIGADDLDENEFANQASLYTGGISVSHIIVPSKDDPNSFKASLLFSGSALSSDIEKFIKLIQKMLTKPWLNNTKRINILLSEKVSAFPNRIAENGHYYALLYSSAGISTSSTLQEMWDGITNMRYVKKLLNLSKAELKEIEIHEKEEKKIKEHENNENDVKVEKKDHENDESSKKQKRHLDHEKLNQKIKKDKENEKNKKLRNKIRTQNVNKKINKNVRRREDNNDKSEKIKNEVKTSTKEKATTLSIDNILKNSKQNSLTSILTNAYYKSLVLSSKSSFTASITCCSDDKDKMEELVTNLLKNLPYHSTPSTYNNNKQTNEIIENSKAHFLKYPKTHLKIDSSTFFCGVSVPSPSYNSNSSASFQVAAKLAQAEYLFGAIREKLGAYGAMARYSALMGTTSFLSYRDTSPLLVLKAIDDIIESLATNKKSNLLPPIDDQMVDRAIVQVFSGFDAPIAPKNAGDSLFLSGVDDALLQKRRSALLKVNKKSIVEDFVYIEEKMKNKLGRETIVGGKIDKALIPEFHVVDVFDLDKK